MKKYKKKGLHFPTYTKRKQIKKKTDGNLTTHEKKKNKD